MANFNGIVHVSAEEVYVIPRGVVLIEGKGRGVLAGGYAPSFSDKLVQFEAEKRNRRDLKCRYSGHEVLDDVIEVQIGVTCWQEYQQDYHWSLEQSLALQELGRKQYNDACFYFSCGLGVAMLTCTREGDIVVGIREGSSYTGAIHGAAGWMQFESDFHVIDPVRDAHRELKEEFGISTTEISSLSLVGIVGFPHTREGDFVYVVRTTKEREYFTSGAWKQAVDAKEHTQLVLLSNEVELERLLVEGRLSDNDMARYEVLPPTYYGLEQIVKYKELLPEFKR